MTQFTARYFIVWTAGLIFRHALYLLRIIERVCKKGAQTIWVKYISYLSIKITMSFGDVAPWVYLKIFVEYYQ